MQCAGPEVDMTEQQNGNRLIDCIDQIILGNHIKDHRTLRRSSPQVLRHVEISRKIVCLAENASLPALYLHRHMQGFEEVDRSRIGADHLPWRCTQ